MKRGRTWRDLSAEEREEIKDILISEGGEEDEEVKGESEEWRIRIGGSTITSYESGTVHASEPSEDFVMEIFSKITGTVAEEIKKDYLLGFDETGKGEVLGHSILAGVAIPASLVPKVRSIISSASTKRKKSIQYWDNLFREIEELCDEGLEFEVDEVPPWHVDKYNLNKIMDVVYQRILGRLMRDLNPERCRISIDDYGIGKQLYHYIDSLKEQGSEVNIAEKADIDFIEAKLASLIAKREREKSMESIRKEYSLPDYPVGSGNAGDEQTQDWLRKWKEENDEWPWFVKKSFKPVRELNGKEGKPKKEEPPIRHQLLSSDSSQLFSKGRLSIDSLRVNCPSCGTTLKSCKLTPTGEGWIGRCLDCNEVIDDLDTTLRYYCGHIVPDTSVIKSRVISKDLESSRFFEGFKFLIPPPVRRECDKAGGRRELGKLADYSSMGRIETQEIDITSGEEIPIDDKIVKVAKRFDAIIYTRDKGMYNTAVSNGIFCLRK